MNIVDAIMLGFVQGITEFIPVSSSGHLILADSLFSSGSTFEFDVLLNIGTITAPLIYFRHRILEIILEIKHEKEWRLVLNIVISTIPAALVGYFLSASLKDGLFRHTAIVALMLASIGLLMVVEPKFNKKKNGKLDNLSKKNALSIGLAQAVALIPGTSRSGVTILAGRFSGLSHAQSAEYSFLIARRFLAELSHQRSANVSGIGSAESLNSDGLAVTRQ